MATSVEALLAGFVRALRAAGVSVTPDRTTNFFVAVAELDVGQRVNVYRAGRATLCSEPEHLMTFDRVFKAWFEGQRPQQGLPAMPVPALPAAALTGVGDDAQPEDSEHAQPTATAMEVLRRRDVAELTADERSVLNQLFSQLPVVLPRRRSSRRRPTARRGDIDPRRTLREQLRRMGELGPIRSRRRASRPRRVVLLIDVSGSMSAYADALLRLAHRVLRAGVAGAGPVEVFTIGTRLTRLTRALRLHRDPETALRAAGEMVPDWSGGTRLGEVLQAFADRWGQRSLARGAVLVICSDGWERGDVELLTAQVRRLGRLAHRLVWLNPHRGKAGYQPLQKGIAAVLPHVDHFVAGHSLGAFEEALEVIRRA
jgi:uncharacterized protein with von Willebrand factor type A (vWA) domain